MTNNSSVTPANGQSPNEPKPWPKIEPLPQDFDPDSLKGNIENYIGMTQVPTGIMGPLAIGGKYANGNFMIPMATTEGALVASYNRGAKACTLSGGVQVVCMEEKVQRCPLYRFQSLKEALEFVAFIESQTPVLKQKVSEVSRFAKLLEIIPTVEGNQVTLSFEYFTGDAAGQNMVTISTQHLSEWITANAPVSPVFWYIENNMSGDKKAVSNAFFRTRGKRVSAEITVPREIVAKILKSTPEALERYYENATLSAIQSGAIGINGHYANGLAAIFMACGQDVACVAEAAIGINRFEVTPQKVGGDLYFSVTLPNLIVGTVGGGTRLFTQAQCLEMIGCNGTGTANKFAEICAAAVLAGELSIIAALAEGHFTQAHKILGRR
ncbi:MAG: hydroxymethylglutaryl-CoA reductase [Saprospiraceae bacterium]|nr:hydroxymethylglutaryl-CoA reductase [Saprospiraceae bacterium]